MKKFISKVLCLLVALVLLVGCVSKIGAVKKAFTDEGYSWEQIAEVSKGTEDAGVTKIYVTTKTLSAAVIFELKPGKDAKEAFKKMKDDEDLSSTVQAIVKLYNDAPVTNGNCVIITLSPSALEIFKNA